MNILKNLWNNFKTQPDEWFFYGFLLTFTLSIRKVIKFYPIAGQFNEYTGIYLYLSDIFLVLTILSWLYVILYNKYSILSIATTVPPQKECSTWNILRGRRGTRLMLVSVLALVIWSFISIFWSENQNIAFFRSSKLLEFILLFLYLIFNVPRGTFLRNISRIIISIGLFQSIIGIIQFITQKSIGLIWLRESLISTEIHGVANIIINNDKYIRAYGLFPHPNIFGGFLLLSILITTFYYSLFYAKTDVPRGTSVNTSGAQRTNNLQCSTWNIATSTRILIFLQSIALLLTFSKSALIGLLLFMMYAYYTFVPRGTNILKKLFHVEHRRKLFLIIAIFTISIIVSKPNIDSLLFKSLQERFLYLGISKNIFIDNYLFGLGSGQFVLKMQHFTTSQLEIWQYQPVHNIFLLITNELGIIGLFLFLTILYYAFNTKKQHKQLVNNRGLNQHPLVSVHSTLTKGLLLSGLFIALFDHYLWDIQQGQILFWLALGLFSGLSAFPKMVKTY